MCPFLELSLPPCAAHLTMGSIASAYAHCADRYDTCPVYAKLVLQATSNSYDPTTDKAAAPAAC